MLDFFLKMTSRMLFWSVAITWCNVLCILSHVYSFFLIAFSFCSVFVSIFHRDLLYSVTVWGISDWLFFFTLVLSLYLIVILFWSF